MTELTNSSHVKAKISVIVIHDQYCSLSLSPSIAFTEKYWSNLKNNVEIQSENALPEHWHDFEELLNIETKTCK